MVAMRRAHEFVLRDKKRSLQRQVDEICRAYFDAEDDAVAVPAIRMRLERDFDLAIHLDDQQMHELLGTLPAEALATLVAKKLLDRDPPDTKPAWCAPWGRGFPQIEIEHEQAQAAS
ncbi:hypothetical protein SAMN04488144_13210 [Methylobacterium sp. 190mf]|uniref:hypothetical protein n=1 Tax=Methylobacterium sp. 190mf TaxID=1761798 RepID=UPI00089F5811|nr:hypothetical protein [Methylobacterium sp. 190mf]SEG64343.1 hypothetical protein SAMN04488144_13210 [Methylobacterium sp. 190mf]